MAAMTTINTSNDLIKGENMNENTSQNQDSYPKVYGFSLFDAIFIILSLLAVVVDCFTDLIIVVEYFELGFVTWAVTTLLLIVFPSYIVQMFSLRWHFADSGCTTIHWIIHILSLGLIHRFYCAMQLGLEARRTKSTSDYHKLYAAQNDLSLLHLFESFLESAPQLVVQLYVIASLREFRFFTGLSAAASVFSLALSMVAYSRAQRRVRESGENVSWMGLVSLALWRLSMITSRICSLLILLLALQAWFLLFIGVHWLSMFVWILYQNTDLCDRKWEERCYNAVAAVIYCFCFFNLKDGQSRWRMLSFYALIVLQNLTSLTMFLMFYNDEGSQLGSIAFVGILGGTIVGLLSMAAYYSFYHPSGPITFWGDEPTPHTPTLETTLRTLKHVSGSLHFTETKNVSSSLSDNDPKMSDSKLVLSDSIVIVEESDMEDISTLQEWIKEATDDSETKRTCSPVPELYEGASSVLSAHDYENLAAINIARNAGLRSWRGYCDIDTWAHDDSVGRDGLTTFTSSTTSQDYLDSIAEDYADCKTASSLHTILEESESNCSDRMSSTPGTCALVATIDQIRIATPVQEERNSRVRRTFSLLRERFENCREPPPPAAPWAARECITPTRFASVRDMRDFFLRQVLTPPKLAALRRKMIVSPVV